MLDSTSLGFQIHAAVAEYTQCRKQSPTFPAEVEAAKIRLKDRDNKSTIDDQIADLGLGSLLLREEE